MRSLALFLGWFRLQCFGVLITDEQILLQLLGLF